MTKLPGFVLVTGILLVAFVAQSGGVEPQDEAALKRDKKLQREVNKLLTERRDVLRDRARILEASFREGNQTLESVTAARIALIDADLELADSKADRVRLRESYLDNVKTLELYAKSMFEAGRQSRVAVLGARAERLNAEVNLLREQANSSP